ncbi:Uncharacterised protein [uncultured archaeon]|nr:Uncharacterised protein [uncultured archaeon]
MAMGQRYITPANGSITVYMDPMSYGYRIANVGKKLVVVYDREDKQHYLEPGESMVLDDDRFEAIELNNGV